MLEGGNVPSRHRPAPDTIGARRHAQRRSICKREESKMRGFHTGSLLLGLLAVTALAAHAAAPAPVTAQTKTAHYLLDLQIGPMEMMFMPAQVAAQHPTTGEVMVGGKMAMPKDLATAHHLEVHVHALDGGMVVTDATLTIAVTDAAKNVQELPIATMYGIAEGVPDTHYGNNVSMAPGNYTVDVMVNGEKATFMVTIPAA
jgi:hypothetical protein